MISLIAAVVLVIISGSSRGNAGITVGACGIVAIITSVIGLVFAILGSIEADIDKLPAYIGFIINIIITIAWACLFVIGI